MRWIVALALTVVIDGWALAETSSSILLNEVTAVQLAVKERLPLTDVQNIPQDFQVNPFDSTIKVQFLNEQTVGDAMAVLLDFIGYEFRVHGESIDPIAMNFYQKPLPNVHRTFENVSLLDALISLAGEGFTFEWQRSAADEITAPVAAGRSVDGMFYTQVDRLTGLSR